MLVFLFVNFCLSRVSMGTSLLQLILTLSIGALVVNGIGINSTQAIASAKEAAGLANAHQLRLALELYHLDHNRYPIARDSEELVDILYTKGYIESKPIEIAFQYQAIGDGSSYTMKRD